MADGYAMIRAMNWLDELTAQLRRDSEHPLPGDDPQLDARLAALRDAGRTDKVPNASPQTARLLRQLIALRRPARILEIGMANGYSTLQLARTARATGATITTIDFSRPFFEFGCQNLRDFSFDDLVTPVFGSALAVLPTLPKQQFGLVFIDAQKRQSLELLRAVAPLCTDDAVVVIDDVGQFRHKMADLFDWLDTSSHPHRVLPTEDGDAVLLTVPPGQ